MFWPNWIVVWTCLWLPRITKCDPQKMSQRMSQLGDIHPVIQWIIEVKPRDASASLNFISGVLDYSCEQKTQSSFSEHLSHNLPEVSRYQRKCLIRKSHLHDKILTVDPNIFAIQNINDAKQWNSSGLANIKAIQNIDEYLCFWHCIELYWGPKLKNSRPSTKIVSCP